jgi:hypothetical protein
VRSLRNLRLRERAAVARAVLQRRCCGVCGCGCGSEIGLQLRERASEVLLRSLRPGLLLRLRRGLQCGLECGVARPATAEALSGARAVERGARERGRAQEGARYERERGSTSMEFAPWGGRLVSCVSDNQCAAEGGGGDAPLSVRFLSCTWLTGLPDGAEDGNYCACKPFWRGLTCQQVTPVLLLRGFLTVPSALLAGLALLRALRDLRECPREIRASPGALCLALAACGAGCFALWMSCLSIVRWTGSAMIFAISAYAALSSIVMIYSAGLFCALVFECISAIAEQRTVRQKRWYALFALLVAAELASMLKSRLVWQQIVVCAVGMLVVALLWIRAARQLASTLEKLSAGSAPIVEKARVTREFIKIVFRFLALAFGCLSVIALLDMNGLSPLPVIVSTCLLEAVYFTAIAAFLLRFQDYLGTPLRRAAARSLSRSRVRPSVDRPFHKSSTHVSGARMVDAPVSGAHIGIVSSGVTSSPAQLESAYSVAGQQDEVQKRQGAGPRTSRARDGEPAGCVGEPVVND